MKAARAHTTFSIALAGNPNCGKTTVFNELTGSRQKVGNWPGVTVERTYGVLLDKFNPKNIETKIVDLPGIYALSAVSKDERIALEYLRSGECQLVINIVDAVALERNLYLTMQLIETGCPVIVVLTKKDRAASAGISIDATILEDELGTPVTAINALESSDIASMAAAVQTAVSKIAAKNVFATHQTNYGPLETFVSTLSAAFVSQTLQQTSGSARGLAVRVLEKEDALLDALSDADYYRIERTALEEAQAEETDVLVADLRYNRIGKLVNTCVHRSSVSVTLGERIDRFVLSRLWGIPIFLMIMFAVFWTTISFGGAFIDFFDLAFGALFVDGFAALLGSIGSPEWLIILLAHGIGAGIQIISTFVPILFVMFFMMSVLEESGYMARAAFVMDRLMRKIGLPGKAFVPLILGLGCTIPAIMATRTLDSNRDRFTTIYMAPLMSCGARLPVYALFAAAIFGVRTGGFVVFILYAIGLAISILTGLLVKKAVFAGSVSHFVMELPVWHLPRLSRLLRSGYRRTSTFITRAGASITAVVLVLSFLNSLGVDKNGISFGNEDTQTSVLAGIGRAMTPVFSPMGITKENWPATVGLFTGLFAKEVIVATVNSLYAGMESEQALSDSGRLAAGGGVHEIISGAEESFNLKDALLEAAATIPVKLSELAGSLADPLGLAVVTGEESSTAEELEVDHGTFVMMRTFFTPFAAFAYLLFILIYFPCVAALGAAVHEMGKGLAFFQAGYLTVLAWAVATLFYQLAEGKNIVWAAAALGMLALIAGSFAVLGKSRHVARITVS